jgi:antibiotic biosynthesis monooxygenase (ABM) superfamily enzyme
MYGTVARMRAKPGAEARLDALMRDYESLHVPGYRATYVYRLDADPREAYIVVIFDSKETYDANADSPEQDKRFREMLDLLEGEPEWHDGEITAYIAGGVPA